MFRRLVIFALSLLLLILPRLTPAQRFTSEAPRDEKLSPAIEKKALALLETISEQVPNLHSPVNRVRAEGMIADLLWTRDEKRARALFKTAGDELVSITSNLDFSEPDVYQQFTSLGQQRTELFTRLAAHDPEAALAFLHATSLTVAGDSRGKWYAEMETNLEMQLAGTIAKHSPARALELARAGLKAGVSYGMISLLNQLQEKDPASAQTLYKEMVDQIKREDLTRNYNHAEVAWNLLQFQPPQVNEDVYKDLIGTMIDATLTITPTDQNSINTAQNAYNQLQSAMSQIEKYAPARAAALREWSQNAERTFDPSTRMYQEISRVAQEGSVEDLLALAPRYPAELQFQVYSQAAWKAQANGDVNRARQIITDLISDPAQRHQMLAQIDNQSLESAISQSKIADARQMLSGMKPVDRRVSVLIRLANTLAAKGDQKAALELLAEAKAAADEAPQGLSQMSSQLQLVQGYAALDPEQSFAIMQKLVVRTNELSAAAATLDGFDTRYLKDNEWITPSNTALGSLITNLTQTFVTLSQIDFDRARSLADRIERPELRLAASLLIARAALSGQTMILPMERRIFVREG
jgi:hypothetical protein